MSCFLIFVNTYVCLPNQVILLTTVRHTTAHNHKMDTDLDRWVTKLRQKIPLEEDELVMLCHIVKDLFIQESNIVVRRYYIV